MTFATQRADRVLDIAGAMTNMDGDAELLEEIMEIFMEMAQSQFDTLAQCIQLEEVDQVAIQAHSMKGGASNFCAHDFVASSLKLEKLAKSGSLAGAEDLLQQMKADFAEVAAVYQAINWVEVASNWKD